MMSEKRMMDLEALAAQADNPALLAGVREMATELYRSREMLRELAGLVLEMDVTVNKAMDVLINTGRLEP